MDAGRVKAQIKQFLNNSVHPEQRLPQIKMLEEFLERERILTEDELRRKEEAELHREWDDKNPSAYQ